MYQETAGSRKEVPDSVDDVQAGLGLTSTKHHNSLTGTDGAVEGRFGLRSGRFLMPCTCGATMVFALARRHAGR